MATITNSVFSIITTPTQEEATKRRADEIVDEQIRINPIFCENIRETLCSLEPEEIARYTEQVYSSTVALYKTRRKIYFNVVETLANEGEIWHNDADGNRINLTREEIEELKAGMEKSLIEELRVSSEKNRAEAEQHEINAAHHEANAAQLTASAERKKIALVREAFHNIFYTTKNPVPEEKQAELFDPYLADHSISVRKNSEGKNCLNLDSSNAVINYLSNNPGIGKCDFRAFKSEIHDIQSFLDFLVTPVGSRIRALAFNNEIPENAKDALARTISARTEMNLPLKVQYC